MAEYHPGRFALEQFARAASSFREERRIEAHLRSGCALCQRMVDDLLPRPEPAHQAADLDREPNLCLSPVAAGWTRSSAWPEPNRSHPVIFVPPVRFGAPARRAAARTDLATALEAVAAPQPALDPVAAAEAPFGDSKDSDDARWNRMFARLEQRFAVIAAEQREAPALLSELLSRAPAARTALVRRNPRFRTLSLCDLLLERSLDVGPDDPHAAIALADLSLEMAGKLEDLTYASGVIQDMKARAWGYRANAFRLSGDLLAAEEALAHALSLAEDGSADPLEEARLRELRAALCSDLGWYLEADKLIDKAIAIYDEVKDLHRKGRSLIAKGVCAGANGSPKRAVDLIADGLQLLDHDLEPELVPIARHNLAWFLHDCGESKLAQELIEPLRRGGRCALLTDDSADLRLDWLEARIAHREGRLDEAEQRLCRLRLAFGKRGLNLEAQVATLDLAALYTEQGRPTDAQRLTGDRMPAFLT